MSATPLEYLTLVGTGANTIAGAIRTSNGVNLGASRTSNVTTSVILGAGSGDITAGAINLANGVTLTVGDSGAGNISVTSVTGPGSGTANITFSNSGTVSVSGAVGTNIGTLWLNKLAGNVSFSGSLQVTQFKTDVNAAYDLSLTGSTNSINNFSTSTAFETSGVLTIGALSTDTLTIATGAFAPSVPSSLRLAGTITTSSTTSGAGGITLGDSNTTITLLTDLTLNSSASNSDVSIASAINGGGKALTLNAGTGTISITQAITGMGNLSFTANEINWTATVAGTGTLTLKPTTTSSVINIGNASDAGTSTLDITASELGLLGNTFTGITFGSGSQSGAIYLRANSIFANTVTMQTSGGIYLAGNFTGSGDLNLNGAVTLSGGARTLAAKNNPKR